MGVPGLFRWIRDAFPHTVRVGVPQCDCLYIDLNGLLHECRRMDDLHDVSHAVIVARLFVLLDRCVASLRPGVLLYLALDGVAPRAKAVQQRSRRWIAGRLNEWWVEAYHTTTGLYQDARLPIPVPHVSSKWDSNQISVGTAFMGVVSTGLHHYIRDRKARDPLWEHLSVVLSDTEVVGEGEQKIFDFIRSQGEVGAHNLRHCIYGLDADLIFLSLMLPVPGLTIVRGQEAREGTTACPALDGEAPGDQYSLISVDEVRRSILSAVGHCEDDMAFPWEPQRYL
eukprot:NODE_938_length_1219_cov_99.239316_g705_i0.p1 GENE.NODE_938_length_1219_cov_99.239316_g705_i0~~NODE_938_length_1219_cov_99.239316_g705_i0.p1  ORF type:complete len:283 (-),score=50.41 NODE_938_length_1219_cov_99.239316_g705_i0:307-1155(-)